MRQGIAVICLLALGACSAVRSEVTLNPGPTASSGTGPAVAVLPPVDERHFEVAPHDPSVPSLKYADDINNRGITERALGRKRGTFGAAVGDVLAESPQTAASLIGDRVKAGLIDSGYRIVEPGDPAYAAAPKLSVRIVKFWTYVRVGMTFTLQNETLLRLEGNLPGLPATVAVNESEHFTWALTNGDWPPFLERVLNKIRARVHETIARR